MDPYYESTDINLCAWLMANKIPYRGSYIAPSDSSRAVFRFKHDGCRIPDLIDSYTFNFPVPVQDFVGAMMFLFGEAKKARRNGGAL